MSLVQKDARMSRKQYHLSAAHVRRIEELRDELGLDSDAELIRRAIDTFDPNALDYSERELVEEVAENMIKQIASLNASIDETIKRSEAARKRVADPEWVESVRERTRQEVAADPALLAGVAQLIGA